MNTMTWNLISNPDRANDAVFLIDLQNQTFCYVNDHACKKLGYSRDELLQMGVRDIDPLIDEVSIQKIAEQVRTQGYSLLETYHLTKDGHFFPVEVSGNRFEYQGESFGFFVAREMTEHKQKDEQSALLDYAFNYVDEAMFLIDENARFIQINEKACSSLGYTQEELLGMSIFDIDPDYTQQNWEQSLDDVAKGVISTKLETRHRTKDGRIFPIEVISNRICYQEQNYKIAMVRDITERKAAEKQLTLLNYALDHLKEEVWLIDENARFHYVNQAACRSIGRPQEEMLQLSVPDIKPDYGLEQWREDSQRIKTAGAFTFETSHQSKEGRIFPVEVNANYFEFAGESYSLTLSHDITERKQKDEQLALLDYAFNFVDEAIYLVNSDAQFVQVNEKACLSLGYSREELLSMSIFDIDPDFNPELWQKLLAEYEKGKKSITVESRHQSKDGVIFPIEVRGHYIAYQGQKYSFAMVRDITERKAAEKQLTLLNYALDHIKEEVWLIDENAKLHYVNQAASRSIGCTYEEMLKLSIPDINPNYGLEQWQEDWQRTKTTGSFTFETSHQSKGGSIFPVEVNTNYFEFDGESYTLTLSHDITERHHVEETLKFVAQRGWKDSHESFLVALSQYLAQLFQVDYVIIDKIGTSPMQAETVALYVKGAIVPNMQYDLKGTPCADVMNGKLCCYPERIQQLFPDDAFLVEMQAESYAGLPLWDTAGKVIGLIAVIDSKPLHNTDFISSILQLVATSVAAELERQYSEQALMAREREFRTLAENVPGILIRYDEQCRIRYINQRLAEGCGEQNEPKIGQTLIQLYPNDPLFAELHEIIKNVIATGQPAEIERYFPHHQGGGTWVFSYVAESDDNGHIIGALALGQDISERKRMEDELAARELEFRTLAQNIPDNLLRYDLLCRLRYMNQATLSSLAKALPVIGKTPSQSFPNNQMAMNLQNAIQDVVDTGEARDIEMAWLNANGEMGTHHVRCVAERDSNDKIIGVLALGRDITERKQTEQLLLQREQEFRSLAENMPDNLIRYDRQARVRYLNPAITRSLAPEVLPKLNKTLVESFPDDEKAIAAQLIIERVIATGEAIDTEVCIPNPEGEMRTHHLRYVAEYDNKGNIIGVLVIGRDLTERKQMEIAVQQREQEFRTLVDNLPTTVLRYNRHFQRIYANPAYLQMTGCSETELLNKPLEETWIATNISVASYKAILTQVMRDGEKQEVLLEWTDNDGQLICHALKIVPEYALNGQIQSVLVLGFDFSEQRRQQLVESNRQQVFEKMARNNSLDAILEQVALYVESSKAGRYCAILLIDEAKNHLQLVAAPSFSNSYPAKGDPLTLDIKSQHCLGWVASALCEKRVIMENLHAHPHPCDSLCQNFIREIGAVACWSEPIMSSSTQLLGVVTLYLDQAAQPDENDLALLLQASHLSAIAIERKRIEQQMFYQASYDVLTGLPNRWLFHDRLQEEISKAEVKGHQLALLFIDLDHFKDVNDTLGHKIGDNLLVHAAQRIQNCVRQSDIVARLGGDEFVVILPELGTVLFVERTAEAIIQAMTQPFKLGEYQTYVSASVGIAMYPQDADQAETLVSYADQAMYAAKHAGRNSFNFFTRSMQEQAQQRLYLVNSLRDALEKNQFEVHYQPIIEVASGKAVKAEALLRWHHPVLGMVSPAVFIPLAEETDLIHGIGSWVFCQAADMAKHWNSLSGENELRKVSINMSPRQLIKGNGDQIAIEYLQAIDLDSTYIVVEITEGLLLDDSSDITEKLERLWATGIELSLDDFGTGYSAMAYLKKFDINYLKIDRSFVRELETNPNDRAITEAIVVMAHRLGLKVIAEGVETEGQRALLVAVGCEYIQGYFYAKPMPIETFLSYVLE